MTVDEGTETLEITCTGTNQVSSVDMVKHVTITGEEYKLVFEQNIRKGVKKT